MLIKVTLAERSGKEFTMYGVSQMPSYRFRNPLVSNFLVYFSFAIISTIYRFWLYNYHNNVICITILFTFTKKHSNALVKFLERWTIINQYHQYVKHLDANRKVEKTGKAQIVLVRCVHNVAYNTPWNNGRSCRLFRFVRKGIWQEYGAAYWLYTRTLFSPPVTTVSWLLTFSLPRFSTL